MRSSEVCKLKITDISLTDSTIRIERAKGSFFQTLDANKAEPLLDDFVALQAWLKERRERLRDSFPISKGRCNVT